ncbi:hypothetical protein [Kitasatospora sp. NPDC093806]|uniref:hypothetical protein n=1 Tax=Kitasatospora sp. NPDC093806 TaxID=3155075 RepID=UPI00343D8E01
MNELVPVLAAVATGAATEVGRDAAQSSASRLRQLIRRWRDRGGDDATQAAPTEQDEQQVRELILEALREDPTLAAELTRFHTVNIHVEKGTAFAGDNNGEINLTIN